jgi:hypothetical protein
MGQQSCLSCPVSMGADLKLAIRVIVPALGRPVAGLALFCLLRQGQGRVGAAYIASNARRIGWFVLQRGSKCCEAPGEALHR